MVIISLHFSQSIRYDNYIRLRSHPILIVSLASIWATALHLAFANELPVAEPEQAGFAADRLHEINGVVEDAVAAGKTAGAVVVVLRHGRIAHFSANGWLDIENQVPLQQDTIFRIASMTKPLTTVAGLILWEEGLLKLDEPVSKYLPDLKGIKVYVDGDGDLSKYAPAKQEMTVRDLMRHTSGLTYGGGDTPVDQLYQEKISFDHNEPLHEFVDKIIRLPLKYQPGTRFEYGVSTDVLGRLVEIQSGQSLAEFFEKRIIAPLEMHDTGYSVPDAKINRLAVSYRVGENGRLMVIDSPQSSRYRREAIMHAGGGGLVSTARDYARFCQMLLGGGMLDGQRIVKADTIAMMTQNQIPKEALPIVHGHPRIGWGFGLGFAVRYELANDDPLSPVGECRWGGSASTHFWLSPSDDLAVVVMQQRQPFFRDLEDQIKPVVYKAIVDR